MALYYSDTFFLSLSHTRRFLILAPLGNQVFVEEGVRLTHPDILQVRSHTLSHTIHFYVT